MKRYRLIAMLAIALVCALTFARPARAANRYSMINAHPNQDLGHYFFVQEAETMPKFKWNLGMMMLYYNELLNIKWETIVIDPRGGRTVLVVERHGIDNLVYDYFYGAIGLTDWMTLAIDFPLFVYYQYGWTNANVSSSSNQFFKPGDIWLSAKFRLLDVNKHRIGVALIPSISIPTGKDSHFLGDQGVTGEGKIVIEIKPVKKLRIAFNAAFHTRESVDVNDISFRNTLKFALGARYQVIDNVGLIAEAAVQTAANSFFDKRRTTPAEVRLGAQWRPKGSNLLVGFGGSAGIIHGAGVPRFAGFINVGYSRKISTKPKVVPLSALEELVAQDNCYATAPLEGDVGYRYRVVCTTYYAFDEASAQDPALIEGIVQYVRETPEMVDVEVRGWADPEGTREYNEKLSLERAESVVEQIGRALGTGDGSVRARVLGIGEDPAVVPYRARRTDTLIK